MTPFRNLVLSLVLPAALTLHAKDAPNYQTGTLTDMTSVECGYDENGSKSLVGEVLGTDAQHKKTRAMLCQEYTLRGDTVMYRIRPKDDKHPVLLPIGEKAQFRIKKEKLILRVQEGDGHEREYSVVSMTSVAPRERRGLLIRDNSKRSKPKRTERCKVQSG